MSPFMLVIVGLSLTEPGGTSVGVRNDPMPSYEVCQQRLSAARAWYATNKPQSRILYSDCVSTRPSAPPATVYREYREWVNPPAQPNHWR
jgi:hypothetical protein